MDRQEHRIIEAEKARRRWLDAIESKREQYVIERFWESYVTLAKLAGVKP